MKNNLMHPSKNRNEVEGIKSIYNCDNCGKKSKKSKKITHHLVHMSLGKIHQFCTRKCKTLWIINQQKSD
jgi:DNA-directed RNA polymerase subunit M/transcription elongation factor TFIIS